MPTDIDLYDEQFYNYADRCLAHAAPFIVDDVVATYRAESAIDVGCGSGALMQAFAAAGVRTHGLEHSAAGLALCRSRGLSVTDFDLCDTSCVATGVFDIAVCLEVAEHLPQSVSANLVQLLCAFSPVVVFTAAPPGQGGLGHINEQPYEYWVDLFIDQGFQRDIRTADRWNRHWRSHGVAPFYHQNLMVFAAETVPDGGE